MMHAMHKHAAGEGLEYKFCKFDAASISLDAKGIFEGYASRFGNEDLGGDIVQKGAFSASLAARHARGVKMLYEHDPLQPIGYWTDLAEDAQGLRAKGQLLVDDVAKAREVHALMKAGVLDGLSIGYRVNKSSPDRTRQVRVLEEIDLREISAVLFPMNEEAVISSVKSSADDLPTEREFERLLMQDAGQLGLPRLTRSEIRQFILPGYKSLLKAKQDAGGGVASTPLDAVATALSDELRRFHAAIR